MKVCEIRPVQEMWVYMPQGRVVRQDELTKEKFGAKATSTVDAAMFQALTGEDGPLPSGLLPSIKTATEAGTKKLFQALDDDNKQVIKQKKESKEKDKSEELKPKTVKESGDSVSVIQASLTRLLQRLL